MLRRWKLLLGSPVFQVGLFCLGLLVFNWPVLDVLNGPPKASYFAFFLVWLLFVALFRLVASAIASRGGLDENDSESAGGR